MVWSADGYTAAAPLHNASAAKPSRLQHSALLFPHKQVELFIQRSIRIAYNRPSLCSFFYAFLVIKVMHCLHTLSVTITKISIK